jgi:hypothetical protein
MSEESVGNEAASAGIEYGGWGLLLLYFLKRTCHIARTNGLHIAFGSPCNLSFVLDTNRGSEHLGSEEGVELPTSEEEMEEGESTGEDTSSPEPFSDDSI